MPNGLSSRVSLTHANARCQFELERGTEPLSAWRWLLGERYDHDLQDYCWKLLLQNHPHDSICGCSVDDVHREMETRFAKCEALARQVTREGLEALVARLSAQREEGKRPGLELGATGGSESAAYALRPSDGSAALLYYTIADGYLIAAPEAATVDQAVQVARLGTNLPRSTGFTAQLPRDGRSDLSAVLYQNVGPVLAPLVGQWARSSSRLTDEQRAALQTVGEGFSSTLVYAYAESDRIIVGTTSGGGPLGIGIEDLVSLGGLLTVQDLLSPLGVE